MICKKYAIFLTLIISVLESSHASTCVGSIPYGLNEDILSLPRSSKFCVYEGGESIFFETDEFGGRLLGEPLKSPVNIFGESQALVIDSDRIPLIYDSFGIERARIYATPNNGPYEWLTRLVRRQYTPSDETFFVINLSFDIFRLNSSWKPKNLIGIDISAIEDLMNWPRMLTVRLTLSQLKLRRSTLSGDDRNIKKDLFLSNRDQYLADLQRWFNLAKSTLSNHAIDSKNTMLLVILPYWLNSSLPDEANALAGLKNAVACGIHEGLPAKLISYKYGPGTTTSDARHFSHYAVPKIEGLPPCKRWP